MGNIVAALCCMLCKNGCRPSVVVSALAFHPPSPPLYAFETVGDEKEKDEGNDEDDESDVEVVGEVQDGVPEYCDVDVDGNGDEARAESSASAATGGTHSTSTAETNRNRQKQLQRKQQEKATLRHKRKLRRQLVASKQGRTACNVTFSPQLGPVPATMTDRMEAHLIVSATGTLVPLMMWRKPPTHSVTGRGAAASTATCAQYTVIISHGNAADLGAMFGFNDMLFSHLPDVNIVSYDYTGCVFTCKYAC